MSAISAGMLIYASTVEMLGGDFVFGSLGGNEHARGDAGHSHSHGSELFEGDSATQDGTSQHRDTEKEGSSISQKALAVGSLLAGVAGMALIGIGE